jgi:hypothetical protein
VQQLGKADLAVLVPGHVGSGALDDLGSVGQHSAGSLARAGEESGHAGYSAGPSLRLEECQEHGDQEHREDDDHGELFPSAAGEPMTLPAQILLKHSPRRSQARAAMRRRADRARNARFTQRSGW